MVCPSLQAASALNQINVRVGSRNNNKNENENKKKIKKKQPQLGRLADSWADVWVDRQASVCPLGLPDNGMFVLARGRSKGHCQKFQLAAQFACGSSCRVNIFAQVLISFSLSLFLFLAQRLKGLRKRLRHTRSGTRRSESNSAH